MTSKTAWIPPRPEKTGHKPLYTIGFSYKAAVLLTKILSARALNRLIGKIYAN